MHIQGRQFWLQQSVSVWLDKHYCYDWDATKQGSTIRPLVERV